MKKPVYLLLAVLFFIYGCGGGSGFDAQKEIAGGEKIAQFSAKDIAKKARKYGFKENDFYGMRAYRITYTTHDESGKAVKASGVIVIPTEDGVSAEKKEQLEVIKHNGFAMVIDCHGTIFANKEAPSVYMAESKEPEGTGIIFSAYAGFITLIPDYIGFGESKEHYHPYLLKKSSSKSVKDFINAAVDFANKNMIELTPNRDMYITGYSQGGYVALASLGRMESSLSYNINMAVPMDGPYLLEPFGRALVKAKSFKAPSFVAYIAYAYAKTYGKDIKSLIKEPYASRLDLLFSGNYTREEIDQNLTYTLQGENGLLSDELVEDYSTSWFRLKLLKNSAIETSSYLTPIKLIHCKGDDIVPYEMATSTKKLLNLAGSKVDLITLEDKIGSQPLSHTECALPAYIYTAKMFLKSRVELLGY